jgi:hypothetical protein
VTDHGSTEAQPVLPDTVAKAVRLMQAGAALALAPAPVWVAMNIDRPSVVAYDLLADVIIAGVWWLVARACRQGRAGGRVLASVFFGLASLGQVEALSGRFYVNPPLAIVSALSWLVGLGAVLLLWHGDSAGFFRARR